jgi:hypothetical protein
MLFSPLIRNATALLRALGERYNAFFATVYAARDTSERFQALAQMTDAELAQRGLRRESLAEAIFAGPRI